jgi:putative phage-type endonuclease
MDNHSEDWHNFRIKGIGSSDAGVLMGFTQWKSVTDLWLEKTGKSKKKFTSNSNIDRGIRLEPAIRAHVELIYDMDMPALDGMIHPDFDFIRANLDGWNNEEKILLECKAPNEKAHREAVEGRVPDYYYPQVQHQLLVMNVDFAIYASQLGSRVAIVEVERDLEFQVKLLQREIEFWGFVTRKESPPEDFL